MLMRLMVLGLLGVLAAAPASAGNITYTNGQGSWQSTQCTPPAPPTAMAHDPEMAANDVNAQVAAHDQYARAAQDYMKCVSGEAERDASSTSQIIMSGAQSAMHSVQDAVENSAARFQPKEK